MLPQSLAEAVMVKFTRRRRIVNTAVAVVFYLSAVYLVDRYVIGLPVALTQQRAQAALIERFPELKHTSITKQGKRIYNARWTFDLSDRTWQCYILNWGRHPVSIFGQFEHSGLGWKAVQAVTWEYVSHGPPEP
jgi:hypothetical protein